MTCTHKRTMSVFMKHNDLASVEIPHLSIKREGYMAWIGPFGGDDVSLDICLDCGQLIGWIPQTDEDVRDIFMVYEDDEEDPPPKRSLPKSWPAKLDLDKVTDMDSAMALIEAFEADHGVGWVRYGEPMQLLRDLALKSTSVYYKASAREILSALGLTVD